MSRQPESNPESQRTNEPMLRTVQTHLNTPKNPGIATVLSSQLCTHGKTRSASFVRHIELDFSQTKIAGAYCSGQSFGVIPPGLDDKGNPHKFRLFSIASPTRGEDGQGTVLAATVKRVIDERWQDQTLFLGVASNYLCNLKPREQIMVTGPSGKRFVLPEDPSLHNYVFFATGTGIAPFRAFILELLSLEIESKIVFVMGAPFATDLLYHEEFLSLSDKYDQFTYLTALSRQPQLDGSAPSYVQSCLGTHAELLVPLLEDPRTLVYVCGIAGMELGIFKEMAHQLSPETRSQYVRVEKDVLKDIPNWSRKMIPKQIKPTRRVMLEVY